MAALHMLYLAPFAEYVAAMVSVLRQVVAAVSNTLVILFYTMTLRQKLTA